MGEGRRGPAGGAGARGARGGASGAGLQGPAAGAGAGAPVWRLQRWRLGKLLKFGGEQLCLESQFRDGGVGRCRMGGGQGPSGGQGTLVEVVCVRCVCVHAFDFVCEIYINHEATLKK